MPLRHSEDDDDDDDDCLISSVEQQTAEWKVAGSNPS